MALRTRNIYNEKEIKKIALYRSANHTKSVSGFEVSDRNIVDHNCTIGKIYYHTGKQTVYSIFPHA